MSSDERAILELARHWKEGRLLPVHPTIAHRFNRALVAAHEDPVPFRRTTDERAPSLAELIRREYECASGMQDQRTLAA